MDRPTAARAVVAAVLGMLAPAVHAAAGIALPAGRTTLPLIGLQVPTPALWAAAGGAALPALWWFMRRRRNRPGTGADDEPAGEEEAPPAF